MLFNEESYVHIRLKYIINRLLWMSRREDVTTIRKVNYVVINAVFRNTIYMYSMYMWN